MKKIRKNTLPWQHKQINNINKDIVTLGMCGFSAITGNTDTEVVAHCTDLNYYQCRCTDSDGRRRTEFTEHCVSQYISDTSAGAQCCIEHRYPLHMCTHCSLYCLQNEYYVHRS